MSTFRQRVLAPRRSRARMRSPEQGLQRVCVNVLASFCPPPPEGPAWTAVNPIPAKSKAAAGLSKAMGMRAGWPDLQLIFRGRAITIEMKAEDGRLSDAQKERKVEIEAAGGLWFEVRSLKEFVGVLDALGVPCKVNRMYLPES